MFGFGRLKDENALIDQLADANSRAERYKASAMLWKDTARALQSEIDALQPLADYAIKQKANRARYDRKRGK